MCRVGVMKGGDEKQKSMNNSCDDSNALRGWGGGFVTLGHLSRASALRVFVLADKKPGGGAEVTSRCLKVCVCVIFLHKRDPILT